ncbi:MAG TPA: EVE domain-containing protein [Chitinophagaceae bacterium]|nr:EVE domain-containing protein [Chitinophagaceae bacterium]
MNYWLIKSEPFKYSWSQFLKDKVTGWDGVRNYAARNNLRDMRLGDLAFFYHSNEGLDIVGIAEVVRESYQDPTTIEPAWLAVDFKPVCTLIEPVSLQVMKQDSKLQNMDLIRLSRLSVGKVTPTEFKHILKLAKTKYS